MFASKKKEAEENKERLTLYRQKYDLLKDEIEALANKIASSKQQHQPQPQPQPQPQLKRQGSQEGQQQQRQQHQEQKGKQLRQQKSGELQAKKEKEKEKDRKASPRKGSKSSGSGIGGVDGDGEAGVVDGGKAPPRLKKKRSQQAFQVNMFAKEFSDDEDEAEDDTNEEDEAEEEDEVEVLDEDGSKKEKTKKPGKTKKKNKNKQKKKKTKVKKDEDTEFLLAYITQLQEARDEIDRMHKVAMQTTMEGQDEWRDVIKWQRRIEEFEPFVGKVKATTGIGNDPLEKEREKEKEKEKETDKGRDGEVEQEKEKEKKKERRGKAESGDEKRGKKEKKLKKEKEGKDQVSDKKKDNDKDQEKEKEKEKEKAKLQQPSKLKLSKSLSVEMERGSRGADGASGEIIDRPAIKIAITAASADSYLLDDSNNDNSNPSNQSNANSSSDAKGLSVGDGRPRSPKSTTQMTDFEKKRLLKSSLLKKDMRSINLKDVAHTTNSKSATVDLSTNVDRQRFLASSTDSSSPSSTSSSNDSSSSSSSSSSHSDDKSKRNLAAFSGFASSPAFQLSPRGSSSSSTSSKSAPSKSTETTPRSTTVACLVHSEKDSSDSDEDFTSPLTSPHQSVDPKRREESAEELVVKRKAKLEELVETQEKYTDNMRQLVKFFMHPLQAAAAARSGLVATTEQVEAIFANLNDILRLSEAVILRLKEGVAQDAVGKAFLNFVSALNVYSFYYRNYDKAIQTVNQLKRKLAFTEFMKILSEKSGGIWMESYLFMPVQQLPKYELLLKDIIKFTPEGHADRADLTAALSAVHEVVVKINVRTKSLEAHEQVALVQSQLISSPNLVSVNRRYIHEGWWIKLKDSKKTQVITSSTPRLYAFLFNDCYVTTKPEEGKIPTPISMIQPDTSALGQSLKFHSMTLFDQVKWQLVRKQVRFSKKGEGGLFACIEIAKDTKEKSCKDYEVWLLGSTEGQNTMWQDKMIALIKDHSERDSVALTSIGMTMLSSLMNELRLDEQLSKDQSLTSPTLPTTIPISPRTADTVASFCGTSSAQAATSTKSTEKSGSASTSPMMSPHNSGEMAAIKTSRKKSESGNKKEST